MLYSAYIRSFYDSLQFSYIPDNMTKEELNAWKQGYKDQKENNQLKTIEEFLGIQ